MLYLERNINNGEQKIYKYDNNYGASVVCHSFSYGGNEGLWELAVIYFHEEDNWHITYDTEVTNNVIGHLEWDEVENILERIENL